MSNFNVLSALRTMLEIKRKALSRLEDDIAAGAITFNKEAVFKDGIRDAAVVSSGTGWHIGYVRMGIPSWRWINCLSAWKRSSVNW